MRSPVTNANMDMMAKPGEMDLREGENMLTSQLLKILMKEKSPLFSDTNVTIMMETKLNGT